MTLEQLCDEAMRLESIIQIVQPLRVRGPLQAEIRGIVCDSRQVRPGYVFVALHGARREGAAFVGDAVARGAAAVVSEDEQLGRRDVTHIHVEDARRALAEISCAFFENPSSKLLTVGVTGTNGKTTTSYMIRDALRAAGLAPGLVGTVAYEIGERRIPASRTTPEAPDLQSMMDQMVHAECRSVVMEVSSHALAQKRVWGVDFDIGVFTNLTRDHLDYHGTMQEYFAAKCLLFRGLGQMQKKATAVINIDDPFGQQLATTGAWCSLVTFGLHETAMVRAEDLELDASGASFRLVTPWGEAPVRLSVLGRFNVSNALAAAAACGAAGLAPGAVAAALGAFRSAPGRLESVPNDRGVQVFVDYAHTDDALANVLSTLRELAPRRLIVVFGCGGDRDRTKRPLMGAAAARYADRIVVTSDNPRSEDPGRIIEEIVGGLPPSAPFETVEDRELAIEKAVRLARPGDIVLIAGKGHENYQEFRNTVIPFDDREVARRALEG